MFGGRAKIRLRNVCWLALLTVAFLPSWAEAASIAFRNDTDAPVMVQGMSIINRTVRRSKVHVLQPGEIAREPIIAPGNKLIVIADAKQPTRILFQDTIQFTGGDLLLSIQPDVPDKAKEKDPKEKGNPPRESSPKGKPSKSVVPQVKLVPVKPTPPSSQSKSATPRR